MKNRIRLLSMLMLITLTALTACGAKPESEPAGAAPNDLQTIEAAAEDIIDFAPSGNWDKISPDVTDIANAWKSYQLQASKDGASQELQDAMKAAIEKLQPPRRRKTRQRPCKAQTMSARRCWTSSCRILNIQSSTSSVYLIRPAKMSKQPRN